MSPLEILRRSSLDMFLLSDIFSTSQEDFLRQLTFKNVPLKILNQAIYLRQMERIYKVFSPSNKLRQSSIFFKGSLVLNYLKVSHSFILVKFLTKYTFKDVCAYLSRLHYTRSVRKVSGLPLYLRVIVFERPLRGMNVNSKASRTYRLLDDICQTYSSCAACLSFQNYF